MLGSSQESSSRITADGVVALTGLPGAGRSVRPRVSWPVPVAASKMFLHALYSSLLQGWAAAGAGRGHEKVVQSSKAFSHPPTGQVGAQEPSEEQKRGQGSASRQGGAGLGAGAGGWGGGGGQGSGSCQKASGFGVGCEEGNPEERTVQRLQESPRLRLWPAAKSALTRLIGKWSFEQGAAGELAV